MGYAIKNISELDSFDFTNSVCTKETVRKSLNGSQWIVEGDAINDYSRDQMLQYLTNNKSAWEAQIDNL